MQCRHYRWRSYTSNGKHTLVQPGDEARARLGNILTFFRKTKRLTDTALNNIFNHSEDDSFDKIKFFFIDRIIDDYYRHVTLNYDINIHCVGHALSCKKYYWIMPIKMDNPMEAINFKVNEAPLSGTNLIEASAGTGKTFSIGILVLRTIVEKNIPIDNQLIVTTNYAVAELQTGYENFFLRLLKSSLQVGVSIDS